MTPWGDGIPEFDDHPAGAWGDGVPLGPAEAGGAAPQVVSAALLSCSVLRVVYDSEVKHVAAVAADDALNPANYTIAGPIALTVTSVAVSQAAPTIVDLTISGIVQNLGAYTVTVANVKSADSVEIDAAHNSATFSGIQCQAQNWIAEILIGGSVVWNATNAVPQQSLELNVSAHTGVKTLKLRIRGLE